MTDFILIEGDKANFLPNFGAAVVVLMIWLPGGLLSLRERLHRKGGPQ